MQKQNVSDILEAIRSVKKQMQAAQNRGDKAKMAEYTGNLIALENCLVTEAQKLIDLDKPVSTPIQGKTEFERRLAMYDDNCTTCQAAKLVGAVCADCADKVGLIDNVIRVDFKAKRRIAS